jgi:N-acetylglucosaminyl-diphospho-decaprenol L-rhamnosyltransferase
VQNGVAEVYVVDNHSTDGSIAAARAAAPWARVIDSGRNVGFGTAVNQVAARARGEWLLAANADTALEPGALDSMLSAAERASVGCVAPRLVLPDGATQHSVHPFPTVPFTLAFNLGLLNLSRGIADRACLQHSWNPDQARNVPWAVGACLLLRRAAFDAVGQFDERQWMYAEDLDLQWRMSETGWTTWYEPEARVRHEFSASTAPAFGDTRRTRFLGATYAMLRRRRGAPRMWLTATINIAGAGARALWMLPLGRLSRRWRAGGEDSRSWLRAHLQAIKLLDSGLEAR